LYKLSLTLVFYFRLWFDYRSELTDKVKTFDWVKKISLPVKSGV